MYQETCSFLGINISSEDDRTVQQQKAFWERPLEFLWWLLEARRKGEKFTRTHIGLLIQGKEGPREEQGVSEAAGYTGTRGDS